MKSSLQKMTMMLLRPLLVNHLLCLQLLRHLPSYAYGAHDGGDMMYLVPHWIVSPDMCRPGIDPQRGW